MIELQHALPEPTELRAYRGRHPGGPWETATFDAVRPMLRRQLNLEQQGLCVYCESRLEEEDGHIEHIKSRGQHPQLTFAYANLAHSCSQPDHCGHQKQDQVLPVEPRPGCNRYFALSALDGRLAPALRLTEAEAQQADDTVCILGLNVPALAWQRKGYAVTIRALADPADVTAFMATIPFRWSLRGLIDD